MESNLTLHFLFLVTFCILHFPINAQGNTLSNCQGLHIEADIVSACTWGSDGEIKLKISQGLPPYQIEWDDGSAGNSRRVDAGNYQVKVIDALGCQASKEFTVEPSTEITVNLQVRHASKPGKSNGEINLSVHGGTSPYKYTWISSSQGVLYAAQQNIDRVKKLPSGIYQILVFDAAGCYTEIETEVR